MLIMVLYLTISAATRERIYNKRELQKNKFIIKNQMFQPFTQVKTCKNYSCKEN